MSARYCRQTGKIMHFSVGEAAAHLRSLEQMRPEYKGEVYVCLHCKQFHVGRRWID